MAPGCLGSPRVELKGLTQVRNILNVIQLYRANPCLWNPKCKNYNNITETQNAWFRITRLLNGLYTTDEIKNIIYNLHEYFEDESELMEMKKQQGIKKPQPSHIYFYALQFLNGNNSEPSANIDKADGRKIRKKKKLHHDTTVFGKQKSSKVSRTFSNTGSFLCATLSEFQIKQPLPLICQVHGSNASKENNPYNGMRYPVEMSSKSLYLKSTAFGKPILETGLKTFSFLLDKIDPKKVADAFAKLKPHKKNKVHFKKEVFSNIYEEVKVPDNDNEVPSVSFSQLKGLNFIKPVPKVCRNNFNMNVMIFDKNTNKLSVVSETSLDSLPKLSISQVLKKEDTRENPNELKTKLSKSQDLEGEKLPESGESPYMKGGQEQEISELQKEKQYRSRRLPVLVIIKKHKPSNYHRARSGQCSVRPKQSSYSLKSIERQFNLFNSGQSKAPLTEQDPYQLCALTSNETDLEVAQQAFTYIEQEEEKNMDILEFF